MPIRPMPNRPGEHYYLVCFNKHGIERADDPDAHAQGGVLSLAVQGFLEKNPNVTDVFVASHGWKGDVPNAEIHYDEWVGEMVANAPERGDSTNVATSLVVAIHWPSLPWGDERLLAAAVSEQDPIAQAKAVDALVNHYADRIADNDDARQAMRTLLSPESPDAAEEPLPAHLKTAYQIVQDQARNQSAPLSEPGDAPDPDDVLHDLGRGAALTTGDAQTRILGGLRARIGHRGLQLLRQLSFRTMKDRASEVGRGDVHNLLASLRTMAPNARLHLMGHSFGCIVVTAAVKGPQGVEPVQVDTMFLVQGAISLWAYADAIQDEPHTPGYYRDIRASNVSGAIVTTTSRHDHAVGFWYPAGAILWDDVTGQRIEGRAPLVGALGAWGAHGIGDPPVHEIEVADDEYIFLPRGVYNVNCDDVICNGGWPSGAHSDIVKPAIAKLFWRATLASPRSRG